MFNVTWESESEAVRVAKEAISNFIKGLPIGDMISAVELVDDYAFVHWDNDSMVFTKQADGTYQYKFTENGLE
jgi:hypothetical protein